MVMPVYGHNHPKSLVTHISDGYTLLREWLFMVMQLTSRDSYKIPSTIASWNFRTIITSYLFTAIAVYGYACLLVSK